MVLRLTCLASAMAVLSATATATAQTPPPNSATTTAPAKDDVLLRANVINEDHKNQIITAEGDVEVRVGVRTLRADRLIYNQSEHTVRAQGHVQVTDDKGQAQFSDDLQADEDFTNGFATRFSARLTANAMLAASSAIRTDGVRNSLEQVVYTGCPVCEETGQTPTWSIRARRAVQNAETQMITYEDAVFEVKGVPLLYLPWFAHPDPTSERRSGFIPAQKPIGLSSKLGVFLETPYYWSISPSQDLTVSPLFSTAVKPLIKLDYRKRFFSGFVDFDGSFTHEQEFSSHGDKFGDDTWRSHIYGRGVFDINEQWKWGFGVEHQTDDLYDRRYGIDGEDELRGLIASQPRQLITQLYTTGQDKDFYFEASSYFFQGLRAGDVDAKIPKVAPSIFTEKSFDLGPYGRVQTDFSAVGLFRDAVETLPSGELALNDARATGSANWTAQYIVGPGLVVAPFAFGRGDAYRIDKSTTSGAQNVDRVLGVAGAQVSYPFIRRGENTDIIIEPIVMVGYGTPHANSKSIPNEDSQVFEADDSNLFKPNPVSNYDLWEGGARAAVGLSATARVGKDVELSTTVGRRWRQDADPAFNDLSNLAGKKSDYVGAVRADIGAILAVGARMRLDDKLAVQHIDVDASANFWRISGRARYFEVAQNAQGLRDEGIAWNGSFKFDNHWSAIIEQARNIVQKEDIRLSLGIAYQDDCSYFALTYDRLGGRDRTLGPSESIGFRFALTGLGGYTAN